MKKNEKNVPKRRFKEFQNAEAWKQRKLKQFANFAKGQGYSKNDLIDVGTPIILYGRLYTKYQSTISEVDTFAVPKSGSVYSTGEEVIVPASGETAEDIARASAIVKSGLLLGGDLNIIYPYKDISTVFLALSISNGKQKKELSKRAQGKSVVHLHNSDLEDVTISFPSRDEQERIGRVFEHLDNLITLHQRKIEKMKALKKAYLTDMFPAEGEHKPKQRFAGFTDDWELRKLKDVSTYSNGGSFENDVQEKGKYELITLKSVDMDGNLVHSGRYVDIEAPTLTKGTLVMILSEQSPGLLGMTAQIPTDNMYILNQRVAEIRPNQGLDSYFLSMAINKNQQYFSRCGAGTKVQNISKSNVENYEFLCPPLQEQQKIGQFFTTLNNLITIHQRKLEKLQNIKKAYLNEMFI